MSACCTAPPDLNEPRDSSPDSDGNDAARLAGDWLRIGIAAIVAMLSMTFGLAVNISPPGPDARPWLHGILAMSAVVVFFLVGGPLCRRAWTEAKAGRVAVEQLFLLGILGAFGASVHCSLTGHGDIYYEIVAILLAIYNFGRIIGDQRRDLVRRAADGLREQFDQCVKVSCDGAERRVAVKSIEAGDRVLVRPGEGVPIDGRVVTGLGFVREASITGEPFPVVKRPGDQILAGGHVLDQALTIEATSPGTARELDRLLDAVRAAQMHPSELQREADHMVAWFLPAVLGIAILTGIGWTIGSGWITGVFNALAVLLVACPCALGLATPIGLWGALGHLAQRGILASSGELVERLARVDTVVFDKTGTLSDEDMALVDFVTDESSGVARETLKQWIARIEGASAHPVARAFRGWPASDVTEGPSLETLPGIGLVAEVAGRDGRSHRVAIGNRGLIRNASDRTLAEKLEAQLAPDAVAKAALLLFVVVDGSVVAVAALRERLRESAASALEQLRAANVELHVMTGDRAENVAALGLSALPADHLHVSMSPTEKSGLVERMQAAGRRVLFVGDGLNDSAALARAHAGLALASGASLSREAAPGQLIGGDLSAVPDAIATCRATMRAVRSNLLFAAGYNLIGITLAVSGVLHPVVAALLMLASSVTVTTRALSATNRQAVLKDLPPPPAAGLLENLGRHIGFLRDARATAAGAACVALGVMLAWHGTARATGWAVLLTSFTLGGFLLARWLASPVSGVRTSDRFSEAYRWRGLAEMFAFGNLAMLIGWWADAGFGPIIRDGVCLCPCPGFGPGLLHFVNWMNLGMLAGSLSMWPRGGDWRAFGHFAVMLAGMFLGMIAVEQFMSKLVVVDPVRHFYLATAAMAVAMGLGMLLACEAWRRTVARREIAASNETSAPTGPVEA